MKRIVEGQFCQSRERHEFRIQLGSAELHAIDVNQFPVRWIKAGWSLIAVLNHSSASRTRIAPQLDLTANHSRLGGHVMLVGNASKIFQCLIILFARDRELGTEEPVERRGQTRPFELLQSRFHTLKPTGREVILRSLPEQF